MIGSPNSGVRPPLAAPILLGVIACFGFAAAPGNVSAKPPATGTVLPLAGKPFDASVISVTESEVEFKTADGAKTLPLNEFVQWGNVVENRRDAQIIFADGGVLVADVLSVKDDWIRADSSLWGQLKIPLRTVRGVLLQPSWRAEEFDELYFQIQTHAEKTDRVELFGGDALEGVLLKFLATDLYDAGAIRLRTPDSVDAIEGSDERVRALLFNSSLTNKPPARERITWCGWTDGSLLPVAEMKTTSGLVELTLHSGVVISTDEQTFTEELTYVAPENKRVAWLSSKPALAYKHTPFLNQPWRLQLDRNVRGGRLRSEASVHPHGIGMHSRSRVAFKTDGADRFQAEVALDSVAGKEGSAVFRVYLNQAGGWQPAWQSELIRGGDKPTSVDLPVADAAAILLIVDFGDRGDVGDCANWLNARLISK